MLVDPKTIPLPASEMPSPAPNASEQEIPPCVTPPGQNATPELGCPYPQPSAFYPSSSFLSSSLSPIPLPVAPAFPSSTQPQFLRPKEQSQELCQHYFKGGFCAYSAETCPFRHILSPDEYSSLTRQHSSTAQNHVTQKQCMFYALGTCKNGDTCPYLHTPSQRDVVQGTESPAVNCNDSPRQGSQQPNEHSGSTRNFVPRKPCNYFSQGKCRKGDSCAFSHERDSPSPVVKEASGGWDNDPSDNFGWGSKDDSWSSPPAGTKNENEAPSCGNGDDPWGNTTTKASDWTGPWDTNDNANQETQSPASSSRPRRSKPSTSRSSGKRSRVSTPLRNASPRTHIPEHTGWSTGVDVSANEPQAETSAAEAPNATSSWDVGAEGNDIEAESRPSQGEVDPWVDSEQDTWGATPNSSSWNSTGQEYNGDAPTASQLDDAATWERGWGEPASTQNEEPANTPAKELPCKFFGQGHCKLGDDCRFAHIPQEGFGKTLDSEQSDGFAAEEVQHEEESPASADASIQYNNAIPAEQHLFHCRVQFGPGGDPEEVTTCFESRTVHVTNIQDITWDEQDELKRLVDTYGTICDEETEQSDAGVQISLEYSTVAEAALASRSLNNYQLGSHRLVAHVQSSASIEHNHQPLPNSCWVKVTYPTPCLNAWCFYQSMTKAKQESIRLDGKILNGRVVQASLPPRVKRSHINAYPILLENLTPETTKDDIRRFCEGTTLVECTKQTYTESPLEDIRRLMHGCGDVDAFEYIRPSPSKSKALAFTRFRDDTAAGLAVQHNGTKQMFLGGGKISVQHCYHQRFDVPSLKFCVIESELSAMRDAPSSDCKVQWDEDRDNVHVRLFSTRPQALARTKNALHVLVYGEIMLGGDGATNPFWHEYFDSPSGSKSLAKLNQDAEYFIELDFRNRHVLLFGSEAGRSRAQQKLLRLIKKVEDICYSLDLTGPTIRFLLEQGIQTLTDAGIGSNQMLLDVATRKLSLWTEEFDDVHRVAELINDSQCGPDTSVQKSGDCVICRLPTIERTELSCSHPYCKRCLTRYIRSRISPPFEKLVCLAQIQDDDESAPFKCATEISFSLIGDLLGAEDTPLLLESSFLNYIQTRSNEFKMCPTLFSHDGLSCSEYMKAVNQGSLNDGSQAESQSDQPAPSPPIFTK
ncbi:hypothetical protein V5O48_004083 [Marasmius crinis-equi]|uniref:C3H1-type domain-containing protein n=1 Tax=Marasmius crinis-equi TaxID=585013 RepID=A0ABR3FR34_9AGAR